MKHTRQYIVIMLLLLAALGAYAIPKVKYTSPNVLSMLQIPTFTPEWRSRDVSGALDLRDMRYNFISRVFARVYGNKYGESLLFLILDAGNFHHPKVCFTGAGATLTDVPDKEFHIGAHRFMAHCLYSVKGNEKTLLVYWICINKKNVDWTGQKIAQLWYSLFNKQKVGYMLRLEIPTSSAARIPNSLKLAEEFLTAIYDRLPDEQKDYIFGK